MNKPAEKLKSAEELHNIAFGFLEEIQQFSEHPEFKGLDTATRTIVGCMNKIRISEVSDIEDDDHETDN